MIVLWLRLPFKEIVYGAKDIAPAIDSRLIQKTIVSVCVCVCVCVLWREKVRENDSDRDGETGREGER